MNTDFVNFLGRLGNYVHPKLIYTYFTVQFSVTALVFIFDTGFPPAILIAGWILLVVFLGLYITRTKRFESREEKVYQEAGLLRMRSISIIRERLQVNPTFRTSCLSCRHCQPEDESCLINAEPGERYFRFKHSDKEVFCLRWELLKKDGTK
jgi:hypothetical protein